MIRLVVRVTLTFVGKLTIQFVFNRNCRKKN